MAGACRCGEDRVEAEEGIEPSFPVCRCVAANARRRWISYVKFVLEF
jgi:hypothetical protein